MILVEKSIDLIWEQHDLIWVGMQSASINEFSHTYSYRKYNGREALAHYTLGGKHTLL